MASEDIVFIDQEAPPTSALKVQIAALPESWAHVWPQEVIKRIFMQLHEIESHESYESLPPRELMFNAFHATPLDKVRVVIIGQDPYHTPNTAIGLSFGVSKESRIPPSLANIFREVKRCYPSSIEDRTLRKWTDQGVLMLNMVSTVKPKCPETAEHARIWRRFTELTLEALVKVSPIFLLWGKKAQAAEGMVEGCRVMMTSHPSPLSASRGFDGCGHFKAVNDLLASPIDW